MYRTRWTVLSLALLGSCFLAPLTARPQDTPPRKDDKKEDKKEQPRTPQGDPRPGGPMMMMGGPMGGQRKILKQFDKDGDGRLNREERQAAREFLKKQGGGRRPGPGGMMFVGGGLGKNLFTALDTDKDGKLTKEELLAGVKTFFQECDKEKKGTLTEAQIADDLGRLLPRPPGMPEGPPPGGPPPGDVLIGGQDGPPPGGFRIMGPGNLFARGIVQRADANKDGKVTLEELTTAAEALFKEADKDKDGKLDEQEVEAAIPLLMPAPGGMGRIGPGGPGRGPGGLGGNREPPKPGPHVSPNEVKTYANASLYEPTVLRTIFLEFEDKDWEAELADFYHTDVEVPATMIVDGKKYPNVGVHFRGASSFFGVGAGYKRSLNVSLDFVDSKQKLLGYKTLNLLNSHDSPSFLDTVLYSHIGRQYLPTPKANLVRVVINGECWGVYTNVQQFNKEFVAENFKTRKGARWKVPGSPGGRGGLEYAGDNIEEYKRRYQIKSEDNDKDWKALINLCKVLNTTPPDKLEEALKPILDIDGLLWFLALDISCINCDGYWIRASDYSIYRDDKGKFHILPHDMNECFRPAQGPGFGGFGGPGGRRGPGGPGGGPPGGQGAQGGPPGGGAAGQAGPRPQPGGSGVDLDPLYGLNDPRKPLRSKILAVPKFREQYLRNVRAIAEEWFDWKKVGPIVAQYRSLVEKEVEADTHKLYTTAEFRRTTADAPPTETASQGRRPGSMSLRTFFEQRRQYLLNHPEIKKLAP
jgi:Ca2+-binding EF-hand superfamily protein